MNMAFEITEDDVRTVLNTAGVTTDNKSISEAFDELDMDSIESAALNGGCDIDEQTSAAHDEIRNQLTEAGLIPASQKFFMLGFCC